MAVSIWYTARRWMRTSIWWAWTMFSSSASYLETKLTFFGHTHLQGGFLLAPRSVKRFVPDRIVQLEPDYYYLINPGSVGQPRDGDPRAAYALYSPEDRTVEFGRVPYDIGKAAAKILQAELPESLAMRLFEGL